MDANWRVVTFGDAGSGKTCFCSQIVQVPEDERKKSTKTVNSYSGFWKGNGPLIDVDDLPGMGDPTIKIDQLLDMFATQMTSKTITAICFFFRVDGHRVTAYHHASLRILRLLIENQSPWNNIILIGTHADKVDADDEGTPEGRLEDIRMQLNDLEIGYDKEKVKASILRKVIFSKKNPEGGLEQFRRHLDELKTKQIKTISTRPDQKEVGKILGQTVGGKNCFAGDMMVRVKRQDKVERVKLTEVKLFDMVQVNDGSFEPVMVLSRHINEDAQLLDFEAKIDRKHEPVRLSLTPLHYIFLCREGKVVHLPAYEAQIGDIFLYSSEEDGATIESKIINIEFRSYDQTINARTKSRTLIVNDILCSSVVKGDAGILGHEFSMLLGRINKNWPNQLNQAALRFRAKVENLVETNLGL